MNERVKVLSTNQPELMSENDRLKERINDLIKTKKSMKQSVNKMKKENEEFQNQKSEYDDKIKELSSQLSELQNENSKLYSEINESKDRYNKDMELLRQSISAVTNKEENSSSTNNNNGSVSNEEISALKKLNKSYVKENNRILKDLGQLKKVKSDLYIIYIYQISFLIIYIEI